MKRISDFFQVTQPSKKARDDDKKEEESSEDKLDNEQSTSQPREKRQFQVKWLTDDRFKNWLVYDEKNASMTCRICTKMSKKNPFTTGCTNFRTSTLIRHQTSADHTNAISDTSEQSNFKKAVETIIDKKHHAILSAMRSVYWLCKEKIATVKFNSLIEFMKIQGCADIENLYSGDNATYQSERSAEDFQEAISTVIENNLKRKLASANFVSLMCDESDDIATKKKLVCYVRLIPESNDFEPETHFLDNVEIDKGDAETVYNALKSAAQNKGIDMKKVMFFGSDGASVMTGKKSGVSARLLHDQPMCKNIHCVAHKLALCTSQSAENVPYLKKYREILTNIFYHFKHSSLRTTNLAKIEEVLHDKQMKIKEVHSVRWFAFYSALQAIFHTWSSLVTYFEQEQQVEKGGVAKGIHTQITQFEFVAVTYLLMDIIPILTNLSLSFQKENIDISMIQPLVQSALNQLKNLLDNDGKYMQEFKAAINETNMKLELRNHSVAITKNKQTHINNIRKDFVQGVIEQIKRRFPHDDTSVISAMAILGLKGVEFINKCELADHGKTELMLLCTQYGTEITDRADVSPVCDNSALQQEWELLKTLVIQQKYPTENIFVLWKILFKHHRQELKNIIKLAELALIAPLQTADCERGFSTQNEIKTADRNRLSANRLSVLMRIAMNKQSIADFDFKEALSVWCKKKERRALQGARK